jgi:hypothetical protein
MVARRAKKSGRTENDQKTCKQKYFLTCKGGKKRSKMFSINRFTQKYS